MLGSSTLGQSVLAGTGGGVNLKTWGFDWFVVDQYEKTWAFDWVVVATIEKTWGFDWIVAASGLKNWSFDWIVKEDPRQNAPSYRDTGTGISRPTAPQSFPVWSTNSRPSVPVPYQAGINTQNANKLEYWHPIAAKWKLYDGTDAPTS